VPLDAPFPEGKSQKLAFVGFNDIGNRGNRVEIGTDLFLQKCSCYYSKSRAVPASSDPGQTHNPPNLSPELI
jgi:hypothetical protein